ncbi:MAG: thioredoxin [Actinomycetaceae bacterium]|nr:thioredoxin [Actinomycetaceae bacterium]
MASVQITQSNYAQYFGEGVEGITLLDFWAEWCGPCKRFGPIFEKTSEKYDDVVFGKINTEEEQGLAMQFGITSIPTLVAFRDGVLVFQQPGAIDGASLERLIEQIKELDMDEVRKKIEEQSA